MNENKTSVPDLLGSPGSGSISQRYGSGSGSFYHPVMYLQKVISRKTFFKLVFVGVLNVNDEIAGSGSDPDSLVRGMDPRIRIQTKMSWIRNTGKNELYL